MMVFAIIKTELLYDTERTKSELIFHDEEYSDDAISTYCGYVSTYYGDDKDAPHRNVKSDIDLMGFSECDWIKGENSDYFYAIIDMESSVKNEYFEAFKNKVIKLSRDKKLKKLI